MACYMCGSRDDLVRHCPNKPPQPPQVLNQEQTASVQQDKRPTRSHPAKDLPATIAGSMVALGSTGTRPVSIGWQRRLPKHLPLPPVPRMPQPRVGGGGGGILHPRGFQPRLWGLA